ncbi:MAG: regulatory signaling modulator protein AmpE [Chromatiales bacterium]|nr:regulatory signaling modulator protein AmpE [Chromatiales bacterium]
MNLIALLIGLVVERLATQLFHWRRMRWLDRIIDFGFRQAERLANWPAIIPVILLGLVLVLPVFAVIWFLGGTLAGFAYLLLAVVVLFFSLGPGDIGEEVREYCKALASDDEERVHNAAKAIVEADVPETLSERTSCVEAAVCVQANNRLFAVVFWFVVLGPLGPLAAWAYRVTDLIRRRAVFSAAREEQSDSHSIRIRDAAEMLHGWLAWMPARLTAVGYAAAGHMDDAIAALRAPTEDRDSSTSARSESLLARVGIAALALQDRPDETPTERAIRGAEAANHLVFKLLLIWAVIIAAMTLYGFTQ